MLKRVCDRCGNIIKNDLISCDLSDNMGIILFEIGPFKKKYRQDGYVKSSYYDCLGEKHTYDICDSCIESFKLWMGGDTNEHR